MIDYQFDDTVNEPKLRGVHATGGRVVVSMISTQYDPAEDQTATIVTVHGADGAYPSPDVEYRPGDTSSKMVATLGMKFESPRMSVCIDRPSPLRDRALGTVMDDFAHSDDYGIDGDQIAITGAGYPCTRACEKMATSDRFYSQVFALVDHPEHGVIAVTPLEFAALGLPEHVD